MANESGSLLDGVHSLKQRQEAGDMWYIHSGRRQKEGMRISGLAGDVPASDSVIYQGRASRLLLGGLPKHGYANDPLISQTNPHRSHSLPGDSGKTLHADTSHLDLSFLDISLDLPEPLPPPQSPSPKGTRGRSRSAGTILGYRASGRRGAAAKAALASMEEGDEEGHEVLGSHSPIPTLVHLENKIINPLAIEAPALIKTSSPLPLHPATKSEDAAAEVNPPDQISPDAATRHQVEPSMDNLSTPPAEPACSSRDPYCIFHGKTPDRIPTERPVDHSPKPSLKTNNEESKDDSHRRHMQLRIEIPKTVPKLSWRFEPVKKYLTTHPSISPPSPASSFGSSESDRESLRPQTPPIPSALSILEWLEHVHPPTIGEENPFSENPESTSRPPPNTPRKPIIEQSAHKTEPEQSGVPLQEHPTSPDRYQSEGEDTKPHNKVAPVPIPLHVLEWLEFQLPKALTMHNQVEDSLPVEHSETRWPTSPKGSLGQAGQTGREELGASQAKHYTHAAAGPIPRHQQLGLEEPAPMAEQQTEEVKKRRFRLKRFNAGKMKKLWRSLLTFFMGKRKGRPASSSSSLLRDETRAPAGPVELTPAAPHLPSEDSTARGGDHADSWNEPMPSYAEVVRNLREGTRGVRLWELLEQSGAERPSVPSRLPPFHFTPIDETKIVKKSSNPSPPSKPPPSPILLRPHIPDHLQTRKKKKNRYHRTYVAIKSFPQRTKQLVAGISQRVRYLKRLLLSLLQNSKRILPSILRLSSTSFRPHK
ncbi:hypothetical protein VP01_310g1 [Puccinia sorghi]|uniref:Uncharacterized protein n=1 Tax=Puccinia sorghi TaxID=27349 RepID=A0A0L6UZD1_9BASI|nr:hypothetical protein VP01_310g1 [Puccinia sorghi]